MKTVVYKVGGSLFDMPELPARLAAATASQPNARPLLIAGGGAAADVVRGWDDLHQLGQETAHRLAIRAMSLGEELLSALLPEACIVSSRRDAETQWIAGRIPILRAADFLRDEEPSTNPKLAQTWNVTSDSIAAWIAARWPADELVLLKSVGVEDAADAVDEEFPSLAARVPIVKWVNLRDETPEWTLWPG